MTCEALRYDKNTNVSQQERVKRLNERRQCLSVRSVDRYLNCSACSGRVVNIFFDFKVMPVDPCSYVQHNFSLTGYLLQAERDKDFNE